MSYRLVDSCSDNWRWNENDKSSEAKLLDEERRTALFHPQWSSGTAGLRGNRALNNGRHYWEIHVSHRIFGTSMMWGVGTIKARLHAEAFVNLLGENEHSWGLSHKGLLWHNGTSRTYIKPFVENKSTTIGLLFNGYKGTLTYYKDGECLGVAFTGLDKVEGTLYPIICSTAAKTQMSVGIRRRSFQDLQDRCRAVIIQSLSCENGLKALYLPVRIQEYLREAAN